MPPLSSVRFPAFRSFRSGQHSPLPDSVGQNGQPNGADFANSQLSSQPSGIFKLLLIFFNDVFTPFQFLGCVSIPSISIQNTQGAVLIDLIFEFRSLICFLLEFFDLMLAEKISGSESYLFGELSYNGDLLFELCLGLSEVFLCFGSARSAKAQHCQLTDPSGTLRLYR